MVSKKKAYEPFEGGNRKIKQYRLLILLGKRLRKQNSSQLDIKNIERDINKRNRRWSDILNLIINFSLAIVTFFLFKEAVHQNEVAKENIRVSMVAAEATLKAANFSDSTYREYKKEAESNQAQFLRTILNAEKSTNAAIISMKISDSLYNVTKKYSQRSDSNYNKSIQIATSTLETTRMSLLLAQENFNILNRSYMLFDGWKIDSIKPLSRLKYSIGFKNYGKTPAHINSVIHNIVVIDTLSDFNIRKYPSPILNYVNYYLPVDKGFEITNVTPAIDPLSYDKMINGKSKLLFYGEILFQDIVTKKAYSYYFSFIVNPDGRFVLTPAHNFVGEVPDVGQWLKKN